jgi:hypothetical protein
VNKPQGKCPAANGAAGHGRRARIIKGCGMKIVNNVADQTKIEFFNRFFEEYEKFPFGSMSKRDLECFLLSLMCSLGIIDISSNRAAANALGINERRLKSYLVDARYKYLEDDKEKNIKKILDAIVEEKIFINVENDQYVFVLEDPILRLDFSQGLKDIHYYSDTSFNTELVKVKHYALIAFLLKYGDSDGKRELIKKIAGKAGGDDKKLLKTLTGQLSWLERGKRIIDYCKGTMELKDILALALSALALIH